MIDAEREALIEKMARAIACHDAPNPKDCLASEWCEENWICYVPEATAAFAVAEAADCIDTIRTENEKLRSANNDLREALAYEQKAATAEIEKLRADLAEYIAQAERGHQTMVAEACELRKEIHRLRAALKRIAEQDAVEMALDPQWARRAAAKAYKETGE